MISLELFAGAGGLALGISKAGFRHAALVEMDKHACDTIRLNQARGVEMVRDWNLYQEDVSKFDYSMVKESIDLLAGGPPCQPFSLGGKHKGHFDRRNLFPEVFRAVRELRPRAFMIENVRGLLRQSFSSYFEYIILCLSYPEVNKKEDENWLQHKSRLDRCHTNYRNVGLHYRVVYKLLKSADYGIPQKRERVFIVGIRSDVGKEWSFPESTHSQDALIWDKWVSGDYWERHGISKKRRTAIDPVTEKKAAKLRCLLEKPAEKPWVTVRDAISDLPKPSNNGNVNGFLNHLFIPGARPYPGHTGSPLDEPAKTLKAGDHGVPGGENMLRYDNGRVRYFTARESARLQTFPDEYAFDCSWTETMRQLGNAVPVELACVVSRSIHSFLSD